MSGTGDYLDSLCESHVGSVYREYSSRETCMSYIVSIYSDQICLKLACHCAPHSSKPLIVVFAHMQCQDANARLYIHYLMPSSFELRLFSNANPKTSSLLIQRVCTEHLHTVS